MTADFFLVNIDTRDQMRCVLERLSSTSKERAGTVLSPTGPERMFPLYSSLRETGWPVYTADHRSTRCGLSPLLCSPTLSQVSPQTTNSWPCTSQALCCYSVTQLCPTLCDRMDCSMPGFPAHHSLPKFAQTHGHWVDDAVQLFHVLSSPSPAFNFSQHLGLFQWAGSSHQVVKVLEFQFQHQSFQWIFWTDFL